MAKVSYKIGGKYDPKGEKDAQKGLKNLTSAAKSFNLAVKGFVAAKVMQGINKVLTGATENFKNQNKAAATYYKTLSNNSKLTQASIKNIDAALTKVSRNNFFDGDTLNYAASLASNMGLNEDQIKNVMSAAADLTASGLMPMDQAVKSLSQTYNGNIASLKKMVPELGNLTDEELKNGEAVKILADRYQGVADAMSNTFSGRDTQIKNSFADLQAAVGGIIEGLKFLGEGVLLKPLQDVTTWLVDNRDNIIRFIIALPDLVKITAGNIGKIIERTFTGQGLTNLLNFLVNAIKVWLSTVWEYVKAIFSDLAALADFTIGNIFRKINNSILEVGNKFIETINKALAVVADNDLVKWVAENLFGASGFDGKNVITFRFTEKQYTTFEQVKDTFAKNSEKIAKSLNDGLNRERNILKSFTENYSDLNTKIVTDIKNVLDNTDLPEDLKRAYESATIEAVTNTTAVLVADDTETEATEDKKSRLSIFDDFITSLKNPLDSLIGSFLTAFTSIESVSALLDWAGTIIGGMMSVLEPIINSLLMPLVGTLRIIGELLGQLIAPVLIALSPIFELLYTWIANLLNLIRPIVQLIAVLIQTCLNPIIAALQIVLTLFTPVFVVLEAFGDALVFLINNVINPVARVILKVVDFVVNGIIGAINGFINAINWALGWLGVHINTLSYSNLSGQVKDIDANSTFTGADLAAAGAVASSSASNYSATRDIIVNVTYANSYVNGDARQIALSIRQEIKAAEALGY